ncbi:asparagine--tRNA ligase SLM5 [Aspergillus saccharolyticus JOP 1030-1]|uniref:Asparaginyl-tRNA synthetase n=1 Tax=Aspergillus saccharolyticus JOP 1030-1 TaxID=1450539 RepID=A0A318Z3L4_9EURO|nr:asparaginyl-tRNA synthetase [Aspergillus saccharolyticus JOP 1030-1]PYH41901.1 asparaginyl-tRNA synthetase [Aspergillus saccharolyticus JOP 1030-1]
MRLWRRSFVTSIARLNSKPAATTSGPPLLRCAQVLDKSRTEPNSLEDQEIKLQGYISHVRKHKRFSFIEFGDGSTVNSLQAMVSTAQAAGLTKGTTLEITGVWKACPPGKSQTHELHATSVDIIGETNAETFPIQKKYQSVDFLRQIPHLRMRIPFNSLLSRFRSEVLYQLGSVFRDAPNGGFVQVQPPLITSSDCEGAGETFTVLPREALGASALPVDGEHFFRSPKYLTVSSQLHLEAYAAELGNVWTLSPSFRAEQSDTPRHLSEFYMLEAEANFMHDLDTLTDLVEHLLRDLTRRLYGTTVAQELIAYKRPVEEGKEDARPDLLPRWRALMDGPKWRRMTYTDAIEKLQEAVATGGALFEYPPTWTGGLQLEHEKYIVDVLNHGQPVFVTDYPKAIKPFYMAPSRENSSSRHGGETVACFDLLLPEVSEVAGGSLREHRLPEIIQNMRDHGLIRQAAAAAATTANENGTSNAPTDVDSSSSAAYPHLLPGEDLGHLQWYADLRRWGTAPHGGFGMGFDRFLSYLAGVSSVRDVVAFPRWFGRADC